MKIITTAFLFMLIISCGKRKLNIGDEKTKVPKDSVDYIASNSIIESDIFWKDSLQSLELGIINQRTLLRLDSVFVVENPFTESYDTVKTYVYRESNCLTYESIYNNDISVESFDFYKPMNIWGMQIGITKENFKKHWSKLFNYNNSDTLIIVSNDLSKDLGVKFIFQNNQLFKVSKISQNFSLKYDRNRVKNGYKR